MHRKRLLVAAIFLPLIYLYIMYLPAGYFSLLLTAITFVALAEFYTMYRLAGTLKNVCLFLGVGIVCTASFYRDLLLDVIVLSIMMTMVFRLFPRRDPASSLADISVPAVGLLYIPSLLSFQSLLRTFGPEWILFLYATVWASDSLAYYIGTGIGKRKLYPEVSPKKTVAGAVGSLIGGIAGTFILRSFFDLHLEVIPAVLIGLMIGSISIIGDLIESMFKRDAGVKDSGSVFPGHGGILDKIDGALFAGPALYWILIITTGTHTP
jgi:phosphatidate cytidylyltransferase